MSMDTPPHRLIYALVALTRRVTCVLHCTVQQYPSKRGFLRVSTITLFFFNYWKPWMAKTWNDYYKSKVQELTYKLVSKTNNLNNNFCLIR